MAQARSERARHPGRGGQPRLLHHADHVRRAPRLSRCWRDPVLRGSVDRSVSEETRRESTRQAADAAREGASEPDALLPGEVRESELPDDAEHWAAVYEELTRFLLESDLDAHMVERYRLRLDYWRRRRDELAGRGPPAEESIDIPP